MTDGLSNVYDGLGSRFKLQVHVTEEGQGYVIVTAGNTETYMLVIQKHNRWFFANENEVSEATYNKMMFDAQFL